MILTIPKVYFCQGAWIETCTEASRWCQIGLLEQKAPFESVVYPLTHIALKPGQEKCPAEVIELGDVDFAVVSRVAIPDDHVKNYSSGRANFLKPGVDIEAYSELFTQEKILPLIKRYPLLELISRLHSHPFSGKARHSPGDLVTIQRDGIVTKEKGFDFSFSFILTPKKRKIFSDWNITCFAVTAGREIPLDVELIPDDHPLAKRARCHPYYKKKVGRRWEMHLEFHIDTVFERHQKRRSPLGWTSFWLKKLEWEIILFIPPFFPNENARMFVSERGKDFEEKDLLLIPGSFPVNLAENILDLLRVS